MSNAAPSMAKKYHKFITERTNSEDGRVDVRLARADEIVMRTAMLESNWMMSNITLMDVKETKGQAVAIGSSGLHTGRVIEGRFNRVLDVDGTPFELVETDSCASLSYREMAALANYGSYGTFEETVDDFFQMAIVLDILRVGFNGQRIAMPTDPVNNPNGEDINRGWHTIAKDFNDGSQVSTAAVTLGDGGDFAHLDALTNNLIKSRIPKRFREDPRLVVLVGSELAAQQRLRLFNGADKPADISAAQMSVSSVAGRFAFVPPFMPGKRLAVTTLANLHVYTQENTRKIRAGFVDERSVYEQGYLRMEGYALQDGFMYAAVDEEALTLIE
ncbi:TPA: P2 family phage major capsid protein [Yersinia enterocolitica]|nr:P2 family phage major capsid protein [Yersinia enterocolitica]HDL8095838.1 P2 family phage major capsid protein [Yersinia enterocolitica]